MEVTEQFISKRYPDEFKRKHTYLVGAVYEKLHGKIVKGRPMTIHMVVNWFYGRNENPYVEDAFAEVINEKRITGN